ncbi:hypothetical protein B7494_g2972 [Chlorociboria aeruginascens]|nr:hypothetical protein B7494_g2972 [Chlorociboria aeruginascens]
MPANLEDPNAAPIYRTSGSAPFPDPHDPQPALPVDVYPRQVTLRDRVTAATIIPFSSHHQVPASLLAYLTDQINKEIEMGDTYPFIEVNSCEKFSTYWFENFAAVMLLGNIESANEIVEGKNWATECLGSFYIKPNYPGRSSHVCNGGFLVTDAARNRGVGRLMGESYLDWAPRLGYTYSVFNLVYETNVASCRIWDALGFKRIGRVKGAGNLKSYPGQFIDAIIYGRELGSENEDFVSEERFDKIKFYLKFGKYPNGADRAEKSRLRSAATHYKLLENDKLMLKDKEVISDPQRQYEIARNVHIQQHGGINKTTATIAEKFHWVRIKETVSLVIRNCAECKELGKTPTVRPDGIIPRRPNMGQTGVSAAGRILSLTHPHSASEFSHSHPTEPATSVSPQVLNRTLPPSHSQDSHTLQSTSQQLQQEQQRHFPAPVAQMSDPTHSHQSMQDTYMPLDPQIMEDVRNHLGSFNQAHDESHHHDHDHDHGDGDNIHFEGHDDRGEEQDSFQAMLGRVTQPEGNGDDDLSMLIDQDEIGGEAEGKMHDEGEGKRDVFGRRFGNG